MKLSVICLDDGKWLDILSNQTFQDFETKIISRNKNDICTEINNCVLDLDSQYLVFVFQEIFSFNNRFELQIDYLENHEKVAAAGCGINVLVNDKLSNIIRYPSNSSKCYSDFFLQKKEFCFDYAMIIRRKCFIEAGGLTRKIRRSEKSLQLALFLSLWVRFLFMKYQITNIFEALIECSLENIQKNEEYYQEKELVWGMFRRKTFSIHPLTHYSPHLFDSL